MNIWIGIDVDDFFKEIKFKALEIEKKLKFDSSCFTLPMHISLKISFEVSSEIYCDVISDIINYYKTINPFIVYIDNIRNEGNIAWIYYKENLFLQKISEDLNKLLFNKYNILLHEYDLDFKFHTTLFMDDDIQKVCQAYNLIENITLPNYFLINKFLIGQSDDGKLGSYKIIKNVENDFVVNGKVYKFIKFLGRGKGGYSYLVKDNNNFYCLKQIHHEPCDYYNFSNKMESELNDYQKIIKIGICIPKMIDYDIEKEIIIKEYIDGYNAMELVENGKMNKKFIKKMLEIEKKCCEFNLNIDYYPTNFIITGDEIYYIDFECNFYDEKWSFSNWGIKYWEK